MWLARRWLPPPRRTMMPGRPARVRRDHSLCTATGDGQHARMQIAQADVKGVADNRDTAAVAPLGHSSTDTTMPTPAPIATSSMRTSPPCWAG